MPKPIRRLKRPAPVLARKMSDNINIQPACRSLRGSIYPLPLPLSDNIFNCLPPSLLVDPSRSTLPSLPRPG